MPSCVSAIRIGKKVQEHLASMANQLQAVIWIWMESLLIVQRNIVNRGIA